MKNLLYFVHTHGGIGHLKRVDNIISQLNFDFPKLYKHTVLISGSYKEIGLFSDRSIEKVFLPHYHFSDITSIDFEETSNKDTFTIRREVYRSLLGRKKFVGALIEHFPLGRMQIKEELQFLIRLFKSSCPGSFVFSSLRDIHDISIGERESIELFDRFLVHGESKYCILPPILEKYSHKCIYTGYVIPHFLKRGSTGSHILVSVGGGRDGEEGIEDFLSKIQKTSFQGEIYIALGSLYSPEREKKLRSLCGFSLIIAHFFPDYDNLKSTCCLFVTQGGYNDFFEVAYLEIPTIFSPRNTEKEQHKRYEIFSRIKKDIFLLTSISSGDIQYILDSKKSTVSNEGNLDFRGAQKTASIIHNFNTLDFLKIRLMNACNATCDMCGVIRRPRKKNSLVKIKQIIRDFYHLGGKIVNFTGGEPTIYPGFFDLLFMVSSFGLKTSVSTNGFCIDHNFIMKATKNKRFCIDFIDISVDALGKKHDDIRGLPGLFEKIVSGISLLKKYHTKIHINYTVRDDNISDVEEVFFYFKNLGVDSLSFSLIDFSPFHSTQHLIPIKADLLKLYTDTFPKIRDQNTIPVSLTPSFSGKDIDTFVDHIITHHDFPRSDGGTCGYIQQKKEIRINENGDISACCEMDDFSSDIGNIYEQDFISLVGVSYHRFLSKTFPHISPACKSCKIYIPSVK